MISLLSTLNDIEAFLPDSSAADALRGDAEAAEAAGVLTARQLEIIQDAGWFRMFVPQECGGLQLPLPQALRLQETLAAIDGSLGWTVTLCSGAGLFAGFVDPALRNAMFTDPRMCIGGSGAPGGTAERVDGGYRVTGAWHYATGAPHLTAFSTNCRILENGAPLTAGDGSEAIRSFLFFPKEVDWRESWPVMGLKATASHSFTITDCIVPAGRSFLIRPEAATSGDLVYKYPFLQFAEMTLAANFGGMGRAFLREFRSGLQAHGGPGARKSLRTAKLIDAERVLDGLLTRFHDTAAASWALLASTGTLTNELLTGISAASRELSAGVRRLTAELFPFAGIGAADPQHGINRIWRDLFTATQHALLTYPADLS